MLIIGAGQTLYIPAGTVLRFDATSSSFAAIEMRNEGTLIGRGKLQSSRYGYTNPPNDWNMDNAKAGISISGGVIRIDLGWIMGFEFGITMTGNNQIYGCNVHVGSFYNNVICVYIDPTDMGFVNQNYIQMDHMAANWAGNSVYQQSYGIYMDSHSPHEPNNNYFRGHIEGYHTGIMLSGAFNRLEGLRLEGCDVKIKIIGSTTRSNNLFGEYGDASDWSGKIQNYTGNSLSYALQLYGIHGLTQVNDITANNIYANYFGPSDSTLKRDIQTVSGALNKVLSLRGTSFKFKSTGKESENSGKKTYGFIAQELKEVLPELVVKNPVDSLYAINYDGVIPVLVEAFKEQHNIIEDQQTEIDKLRSDINNMTDLMEKANIINNIYTKTDEDKAILYQNTPNPFNERTEIKCYLPKIGNKAYILILDMNGRYIKRIDIESTGENSVVINGGTLTPGMYIYTLIVDNKEVGTKRMVLTE